MNILLVLIGCLAADPVVVENAFVRVEVVPDLFLIRYIGVLDKHNWLAPLDLPQSEGENGENGDFGGFVCELVSPKGPELAFPKEPAEIVTKNPLRVVLLGPESKKFPVRLKLDVQVPMAEGNIIVTVTAVASGDVPGKFALRNTACIAQGTTVRINTSDGEFRPLAGTASVFPIVNKSFCYWLIPIPSPGIQQHVVLGAHVPQVSFHKTPYAWTRYCGGKLEEKGTYLEGSNLICTLDGEKREYQVTFQSPLAEIQPDSPLVLKEEWSLESTNR
ncbi:MAG TPA: hypothetical protein PLI09_17655 [Candidatus Hydrogenedentes bacterium]|nr:hypothetical protein [Candidatus Hydrogenedentota bacterium]